MLVLLRVLCDHLPRYLVFLCVTESRLGRSLQLTTTSMCRELVSTSERRHDTATSHTRHPDDGRSPDQLSAARLQSETDSHASQLLDLFH